MRLRSHGGGWTSLDELAGGVLSPSQEAAEEIYVAEAVMDEAGRTGDVMLASETDLCGRNFPPVDQEGPGEWRSLTPELVKALWPAPPKPTGI